MDRVLKTQNDKNLPQSTSPAMPIVTHEQDSKRVESDKPLKSFATFMDLPIEIRLMIWRYSMKPRIISARLYKRERWVSRVWNNCAIGEETFFEPLRRRRKFGEEVGPKSLIYLETNCQSVFGIFDACHRSRNVIKSQDYTRTFRQLGSRATSLFSSKKDTLLILTDVYADIKSMDYRHEYPTEAFDLDSV